MEEIIKKTGLNPNIINSLIDSQRLKKNKLNPNYEINMLHEQMGPAKYLRPHDN